MGVWQPLDTFHTQLQFILPDIKRRVMSVLDLPDDRVFFWQGDDVPYHAEAEQYIVLTVEDSSPDLPNIQGAGRTDTRDTVGLRVLARTRISLDMGDRHDSALMDVAYGILPLRHQVLVALVDYEPQDSNGEIITLAPMKPWRCSKPAPLAKQEWLQSVLWFTIEYELDLPDIVPTRIPINANPAVPDPPYQ